MWRRIFLYMWDLTQISWRALRLNVPEHSTTFEIAKFGQKHIMSLLSGEKRKRIHASSNRK